VKDGDSDLSVTGSFNTTGGVYIHGGVLGLAGLVGTLGQVTTTGGTLSGSGAALDGSGALPAAGLTYNGGAVATPLHSSNTANTTVATFNVSGAVAGGFVLSTSLATSTFAQDTLTPNMVTTLGPIRGGGGFGSNVNFTGPADNSGVFILSP